MKENLEITLETAMLLRKKLTFVNSQLNLQMIQNKRLLRERQQKKDAFEIVTRQLNELRKNPYNCCNKLLNMLKCSYERCRILQKMIEVLEADNRMKTKQLFEVKEAGLEAEINKMKDLLQSRGNDEVVLSQEISSSITSEGSQNENDQLHKLNHEKKMHAAEEVQAEPPRKYCGTLTNVYGDESKNKSVRLDHSLADELNSQQIITNEFQLEIEKFKEELSSFPARNIHLEAKKMQLQLAYDLLEQTPSLPSWLIDILFNYDRFHESK